MSFASGKLAAFAIVVLMPALPAPLSAETVEPPAPQFLGGTLSGNVTLATDYGGRGYTQTEKGFAMQGGIDWSHASGFYVGTWASNLRWAGDIEVDLYAGYASETAGVSWDIGLVYYFYPDEARSPKTDKDRDGDGIDRLVLIVVDGKERVVTEEFPEADYWEASLGLGRSLGPLDLGLGLTYSPDYWGEEGFGAGSAVLVNGDVTLPPLTVGSVALTPYASVLITRNERDGFFARGEDGYLSWNIGVKAGLAEGLTLGLRYNATDLDAEDARASGWTETIAEGLEDGRFITSLTYAF